MNIVFWVLVALAVVALWLLLCTLYQPLGEFIKGLVDDAVYYIKDENEEESEEE